MGTELARQSDVEALVESHPNRLIMLALDRQADPGTLEKLMALQERYERNEARKAYTQAMTSFKQEAPAVLKKNDVVDFLTNKGRTHYKYANLGSIVQEITAVMGKYDLSASWSTEQKGTDVTVTCNITHIAGHRESVTLTGPIDESGNKNRIQAVGSTVTYLQRYTLLAALGLATGEDDDGRGGQGETGRPIDPPRQKEYTTSGTEYTGKVKEVKKKTGEKNGKPWTSYSVIGEDNKEYKTFSESNATIAFNAKSKGLPVKIGFETGQYGNDIKSIAIVEAKADPEECAKNGAECDHFAEDGTCGQTKEACSYV